MAATDETTEAVEVRLERIERIFHRIVDENDLLNQFWTDRNGKRQFPPGMFGIIREEMSSP